MNALAQSQFSQALASLAKPATRKIRRLTLARLDGNRKFAANYYGPCALTAMNVGEWIREAVAFHFECSPDEIETIEDDDRGELLAINGKPVVHMIEEFIEIPN